MGLIGAFGHAVHGGVGLLTISMAADPGATDAYAAALARDEQGAGLPFLVAGTPFMVLGTILLGVAVWRAGAGPRWLGPATIAWVPVEFVGSSLSGWVSYVSVVWYALIFVTMALVVARSSIGHWQTAEEAAAPTPSLVAAS